MAETVHLVVLTRTDKATNVTEYYDQTHRKWVLTMSQATPVDEETGGGLKRSHASKNRDVRAAAYTYDTVAV